MIQVTAWIAPGTNIVYAGSAVKEVDTGTFPAILLTVEEYEELVAKASSTNAKF